VVKISAQLYSLNTKFTRSVTTQYKNLIKNDFQIFQNSLILLNFTLFNSGNLNFFYKNKKNKLKCDILANMMLIQLAANYKFSSVFTRSSILSKL
jgi:hypothetical protein